MRVSREQAEDNRRAVVEAAGKLFRERGFDGVGLNELMGSVGLTHGGFYKQFASKDALALEACERALEKGADGWRRAADAANAEGKDAYAALVERYLAPGHRANVGTGCAFAALAADAARHGPELPRRFEAGIKTYAAILEDAMPDAAPDAALATFSTMVGALLLARAVEDEDYARRILAAAAASLLGDKA
ncbi:TetR/AcrR family transcriptional regulator [uncultured Massilia sp.]|uniref:TetR/AcrR family transcriptional regulator n=1 Tax=uncultured Massilia sp. TaxID=169973 RepID=UPI0025DF6517|nr:TetR/AcrR family transcriptional regulator [uncultured Massilia sp.]